MESDRQSRQRTESQRTRLNEAITNGRLYQTKMILADFISSLNFLDNDGLSPLMRAFMLEDARHRTRTAIVKLLLHHKADVNFRDREGLHALNWACKMNKLDLVKFLLEKCLQDVDLTSQDLEGNAPLLHAVMNNNVDMVTLLVNALKKFSLTVDQRNRRDKTAYLQALEMGYDECANILSKVGKASQDIKVNPFLDFLALPNADPCRKVRVSSAPSAKEYGVIQANDSMKQITVNRGNAPLFHRNRRNFSRNKNRGSMRKSRKIHSVVSSQNCRDKSQKMNPKKGEKQGKAQITKPTTNCQNVQVFLGEELLYSTSGSKNTNVEKRPANEKKDPLLRIILDESPRHGTSGQQSPRSSVSSISYSQMGRTQSRSTSRASLDNKSGGLKALVSTANGKYFRNTDQPLRGENYEARQNEFANYHSYLVWKASLDHPPNTLRSFLALRAEQQSEQSSYRKGIVIPKYDPTLEESENDRSADVTSPVSERSSKSEVGRKISAVAKTVGLSIYLTNKRKNSHRKDA